jgi:hypothetical protein
MLAIAYSKSFRTRWNSFYRISNLVNAINKCSVAKALFPSSAKALSYNNLAAEKFF